MYEFYSYKMSRIEIFFTDLQSSDKATTLK